MLYLLGTFAKLCVCVVFGPGWVMLGLVAVYLVPLSVCRTSLRNKSFSFVDGDLEATYTSYLLSAMKL